MIMIFGLTPLQQCIILTGVAAVLWFIVWEMWRSPNRKPFSWERRARRAARRLRDEAAARMYSPTAYLPAGAGLTVAIPAAPLRLQRAAQRVDVDGRNYARSAGATVAHTTLGLAAEQCPDVAEVTVTGRPRSVGAEYADAGRRAVDTVAEAVRVTPAAPGWDSSPVTPTVLQRAIGHGEGQVFDGNGGADETYAGTLAAVDLTAAADLPGDFQTPEARKVDTDREDAWYAAAFSGMAERHRDMFNDSFASSIKSGATTITEAKACRAEAEARFRAEQLARVELIEDITGELVHA